MRAASSYLRRWQTGIFDMPEVQTFLRDAWAATEPQKAKEAAAAAEQLRAMAAAAAAAALAAASTAAEAQRLRRNEASGENAVTGAGIGAVLGGIVMGFSGCVSCVANAQSQHTLITDFNLFSGLLYGAIGGAVIG